VLQNTLEDVLSKKGIAPYKTVLKGVWVRAHRAAPSLGRFNLRDSGRAALSQHNRKLTGIGSIVKINVTIHP
jgi:hypothetical protein